MPALITSHGLIVGPIGSDAGYIVIGPNGPHRVPGWNPEAAAQVTAAIRVIEAASQIKTGAVQTRMMEAAQTMLKPQMEYIEKALAGPGTQVRAANG